jgi:hypothetical protein
MTGAPPVLDRPALWAALSRMTIDPPEPGLPFEAALAARNGWTRDFAERVTGEYRRFLYLAAVAGFEVTPSQTVDEAWHLHLSWPHYHKVLCSGIVGRELEHRPGTGTPEDEARHRRQYEETLASYERAFGRPAPEDVWPRPSTAGDSEPAAKRRRWGVGYRAAACALAFGGVGFASGMLTVTLLIAGTALLFSLLLDGLRAHGCGSGSSSCGGGLGWSGGDDGCSASCGGGCGGGCGGD